MIEQSDAVTAVSSFLRDETVRVFGVTRPIEVIPNFVDARVFRPRSDDALRARFAPAGERILVHASNFRKVKNLPAVLRVHARVAAALPTRLLLVGDGPEMPAVRADVAALGLADTVAFLGHVDDLAEILPVADVLLLPSLHESFGLVALEAMACGVVPVVTDRGGARDFIEDGINGFLRDPDDIAGMADAVLGILQDPAAREQMAEDAQRDASGDFGVSCVLKQYLDLYDRILGGGRGQETG
jgi:N-acetyl-alpha-D-glucosaminyl L-malate synthase BshA